MSSGARPTVVVCGAGISVEPPSQLPSGEDLAKRTVELLLDSHEVVLDSKAIRKLWPALRKIRLELALELLSRHIDAGTLVQIYAGLRGAPPNYNHLALACADLHSIITINQDVLLEAASTCVGATKEIIHLHGRCDLPETIITLISQYMSALPPDRAQKLRDAVENRVVLVVGYSGRDRDAMQVLGESEPIRIEWILHPGSAESPELGKLRRQLGARLEIDVGSAREKLTELLTHEQEKVIEGILGITQRWCYEVPPEVRVQFAAVERVPRNLGLAEILRHASHHREVDRVYAALGGRGSGSPVSVRLAVGSLLAHRRAFDSAIDAYETVAGSDGASAEERCLALIGQVEAFRNSSRGTQAKRLLLDLDTLVALVPPSRERLRILGRAASHRAGLARVDGDIPLALAEYSVALRAFHESRDLDEKLESSIWRADVLRLKGHFLEAHAEASIAVHESLLYVRYYSRAWALFVSADIDCARGELEACESRLNAAAALFLEADNHQGLLWSELLRAAQLRATGDLDAAAVMLDAAEQRIASGAIPLHLAQIRLNLERAELARAFGLPVMVERHLQHARELISTSQHFTLEPSYLSLHARLVAAECNRSAAPLTAASEFTTIACEYQVLGFYGCAARAQAGAWLCAPDVPPPQDLIDDCRKHGRQLEIARLERHAAEVYPILFA